MVIKSKNVCTAKAISAVLVNRRSNLLRDQFLIIKNIILAILYYRNESWCKYSLGTLYILLGRSPCCNKVSRYFWFIRMVSKSCVFTYHFDNLRNHRCIVSTGPKYHIYEYCIAGPGESNFNNLTTIRRSKCILSFKKLDQFRLKNRLESVGISTQRCFTENIRLIT